MNKKQLYDAMGGRISMSSIGKYSDEIVILGKFGMISWMDDYWDIWVTGVHLDKELSSKKVFYLCSAIKPLVKTLDTELNCEAVAMVQDNEAAFLCAVLLGARRKRNSSPKQLANLKNAA